MKKPEWPGIATAVGIVLILTMITWLGISGPVTSGVVGPVTVLRVLNYAAKWQTLMTGCLAILGVTIAYHGAVLAYRAAMAKVDLDRGKERRELERKQLGLYLRLHFATNKLVNEAQSVVKIARTSSVQPKKFSPMNIRLTPRNEFDEAWTSLDLLPVSATYTLTRFGQSCRERRRDWILSRPNK